GGEPDAETRRNAVRSLADLCEEVGVGRYGGGDGGGCQRERCQHVEGVLGTFSGAAEDYSVDKRGDVGSWCRMDALTGMERLARIAARASRGLP
ncbi:unnamed protein product, partial [Laminaria digitata]